MAQTMYQLEFVMFQGLESHKPEFADKLVRSNEKGPPSEPSTYHRYYPRGHCFGQTKSIRNSAQD